MNSIDRLDSVEQKIREIQKLTIGTTQNKAQREKRLKKLTWETLLNSLTCTSLES